MNQLIYGNINTADYQIGISGGGTYAAPERDVERFEVPGRNGELIVDNGRYKNIEVTYPAYIARKFKDNVEQFRSELMKLKGYQRIEDTYHPDEYRLGTFMGMFDPETVGAYNNSARFDLRFNCKPQRFLKSGDKPIQFLAMALTANGGESQYIPTNGDTIKAEFHNTNGDRTAAEVIFYASNGTTVTGYTYLLDDGYVLERTVPEGSAYWRLTIDDPENEWVKIKTVTQFGGEDIQVDAIFAKTWTLKNPTGYRTSPLIEAYDFQLPDMSIHNYTDGAGTDYTVFGSTGVSGPYHVYLDCDLQYLYDSNGTNVTDHFYLTNSGSAWREGYMFPELGEDEIIIEITGSLAGYAYGSGLVNIYPRWWRL